MIFTRRWLVLFLAGIVPVALTGTSSGGLMELLAVAWYAAIIGAAVADRMITPSPANLTVHRVLEDRLSLGSTNAVSLRVRNGSDHRLNIVLIDSCPESMRLEGDDRVGQSIPLVLEPRSRRTADYLITPTRRGDHFFGSVYLRVTGRLGMVERLRTISARAHIKVYPAMAHLAQYNVMARRGRLQQLGVRKIRMQGVGRDFESLRDYLPDDEMRRIDWKATARRGKLVSRLYEVERSQAIIIVLDVGRTMVAELNGKQKLDYAIDAALHLAYVASLADDMVGLLVFSDSVHAYLPPKRGRSQIYAVLEHLYNATATLAEADYVSALTYLQSRWRKRALIVCFTDLWDPDSARQTTEELGVLQPRHLVCAVTLLDTEVLNTARQAASDAFSVFNKAAAVQVIDEREKALSALTRRGVLVVDSPADSISVDLVNRYLEVKDRMWL